MLEEGVGTQQESDYSPDVQIREVSQFTSLSPVGDTVMAGLPRAHQDTG